MRKQLLILLSFISIQSFSQNGLENITVEKYYVSDANDAITNDIGGVLPVGSVTYRIFVDMLPGYKLQAVYGTPGQNGQPDHELRIATTTLFFNNEDRGATTPSFSKSQANNNTVMLDSWISVGAACNGNFGILKSEDDGDATLANPDGVLQNTNPDAGIPLTQQDGFLAGTTQPVTTLGIDAQLAVFDNQNDGTNGPVFSTTDGAWAALNGADGPNPATNKVLIAQITTDGILSFELNIQVGIPDQGIIERYVASNPDTAAGEIFLESLTYISDTPTAINYLESDVQLFSVYPNPAEGHIFLSTAIQKNAIGRYSVYDMRGQLVTTKIISPFSSVQAEQISLQDFAKGQYIIELIVDGKRATQKFVKK